MSQVSVPFPGRGLAAATSPFLLVGAFLVANRPWLTAGLWRDEASSVYVAAAPTLSEFFFRSMRIDKSPPLFNGIVAVWGRFLGFRETSLAILVAILGVAALSAVFLASCRIAGPWTALFSILFLLDDDVVFWEFFQLRPYVFSIGAFALVLLLALPAEPAESKERRVRGPIALATAILLLAFSHYAGTVAVASVAAWSAFRAGTAPRQDRHYWRQILACTIPAGLLFAAWLPALRWQQKLGVAWSLGDAGARIGNAAESVRAMLPHVGPGGGWLDGIPAVVLLAAFALLAMRRRWRTTDRGISSMSWLLAVPASSVLAVMGWAGGASRYLVIPAACAAILFSVLATGVGRALKDRGTTPAILLGLAALLAVGPVAREAYRWKASDIGRYPPARSGIRRLASSPEFDRAALFVALPSYFARTLWYYGVPESNLRGFPPMRDIVDTEFSLSSPVWTDRQAVPRFLAETKEEARIRGFRRIVVVWGPNPAAEIARATHDVLDGIARAYPLEKQGSFSGYPESVRVAVYDVR